MLSIGERLLTAVMTRYSADNVSGETAIDDDVGAIHCIYHGDSSSDLLTLDLTRLNFNCFSSISFSAPDIKESTMIILNEVSSTLYDFEIQDRFKEYFIIEVPLITENMIHCGFGKLNYITKQTKLT
ncbi:unnamed protein product [Ambrosiozyma monospora]|uniref:Unnamed protein product n=1 Tax=Ambrosiozyma monospora TaxID=43982 RepID=A0ACB5TDX7_AMBMO|nr:unnamed protein product [Ambrosiozyma monospora]